MSDVHFNEPKVMAEIGCNHKGDMEIAKELLNLAKSWLLVCKISKAPGGVAHTRAI